MTNGESTRMSGFSKGLIIGAITGAVVALLYAPKSGSELRGDIQKQVRGLRTDLDRYVFRVRRQVKDIAKSIPSIT